MYSFAIICLIGSTTSTIDWSSVILDPPIGTSAIGGEVDLGGIVLDPPVESTPVGNQLDWSGITIEPPVQPATNGSQIDWSGVNLDGPVHPTTGDDPAWSTRPPEDPRNEPIDNNKTAVADNEAPPNDEGTTPRGCSTALLGVVLGVSMVGLIVSIVQVWFLKSLLNRQSIQTPENVDLEKGNR
ncbi:hypothetical protein Pmar_PMAR020884 [Perkinsus marinus ATCC 50983]|uniref:Uncharacterized protein n=1 Tax=Perkinsus marinus (strain ATCC 50983 / TXsc) TaxID=423536 RepID=C5KN67_PERM5|nr:hypothetical protein Pmar_PMAR020884 [Perkinsus marinus ATCC 50983]EER14101.1 hypothetical protein Pmar_PMAR020884 [Perkinsus marinus ATCC 50983]|eukprot:XP_002782306.1 hypothetical protein Pmar_PMAR020884 [Perkinsus marinus ATCC 50983]